MSPHPTDLPIYFKPSGVCAEIVINAPARRNAFNMRMWAALPGLIADAEAATPAKAVILHGGDTGHFAAGADISEFDEIYATRTRAAETAGIIAEGLNAIERCSKPVIAAIEGVCVGGGVSLALACDMRIASQTARFGITPARLGLVYPPDDTRRLVETVGRSAASEMLFTGRLFDAMHAEASGLVDRLCPETTTFSMARDMVNDIGAVSQWSVRAAKQMIAGALSGESADAGLARFVDGVTGDDFREGYRAFLEKRPPDFPTD